MKKCITCKEEKTFENFSLRSNKKYYLSECKICSGKRSNKWYWDNRQKSLDQRKKYYEKNREESLKKGKERYLAKYNEIRKKANERNRTPEQREMARKRSLEWRNRNREVVRERTTKWKRDNPLKSKAHQYVLWALRLNVLQKPLECQVCGLIKKLEAHHKDYAKPLEVLWVCKLCHEYEHHKDDHECSSTS
ncbi:MAG TPA: hypothetical protein VMT35_07555 [Ignavibacteriaceae bacterium]|nr:hypothetical protein [Ignavibacteriaceae bacterium]